MSPAPRKAEEFSETDAYQIGADLNDFFEGDHEHQAYDAPQDDEDEPAIVPSVRPKFRSCRADEFDFRASSPIVVADATAFWRTDSFQAKLPWLQSPLIWLAGVREDGMARASLDGPHARHLAALITGETAEPFAGSNGRARAHAALHEASESLCDILLRKYGPDPRPAFMAAMGIAGILPSKPSIIGSGNIVHFFHVLGDPDDTCNGWAVLHRCPGAGSFGSWRTAAVHRWHWQPSRMQDFAEQYAQDLERANLAHRQKKAA